MNTPALMPAVIDMTVKSFSITDASPRADSCLGSVPYELFSFTITETGEYQFGFQHENPTNSGEFLLLLLYRAGNFHGDVCNMTNAIGDVTGAVQTLAAGDYELVMAFHEGSTGTFDLVVTRQ